MKRSRLLAFCEGEVTFDFESERFGQLVLTSDDEDADVRAVNQPLHAVQTVAGALVKTT